MTSLRAQGVRAIEERCENILKQHVSKLGSDLRIYGSRPYNSKVSERTIFLCWDEQ